MIIVMFILDCFFIQSLQTDVKSAEMLLHKTNDTGKILMQNSDLDTQNRIQAELNRSNKKSESLIGELDSRQHDLETIIRQWEETEEGMEDLLEWLKDIRKSIMHELPDNYDDLLRELHMCKVSCLLIDTHLIQNCHHYLKTCQSYIHYLIDLF